MKRYSLVLLIATILIVSGCYLESQDDSPAALSFNFFDQSVIGYNGDGDYIIARVYDENALDGIVTVTPPYIVYPIGLMPEAVISEAQYIGDGSNNDAAGIITVLGLPPKRRYKIFLERYSYYTGDGYSSYDQAALTDAFEVSSSGPTAVSAVFLLWTS